MRRVRCCDDADPFLGFPPRLLELLRRFRIIWVDSVVLFLFFSARLSTGKRRKTNNIKSSLWLFAEVAFQQSLVSSSLFRPFLNFISIFFRLVDS
jgi:hypothetical protein